MAISIRESLLLTVGLLFCILGCARDRDHALIPDHISPPMEAHESVAAEAAFEENLLPILTSRCALAGCHVADGPHGLDFRTYESFIAGGEHGPAFIPGNAEGSEIVEQIASGNMPPGGPPLTDVEIQLFVNWINQQEAHDDIVPHDHGHDVDMGADHDAHDDDQDMDDAHDDNDDDLHDDMDDAHDDDDNHDDNDDDLHDDMDDAHDDDDNHDDDN